MGRLHRTGRTGSARRGDHDRDRRPPPARRPTAAIHAHASQVSPFEAMPTELADLFLTRDHLVGSNRLDSEARSRPTSSPPRPADEIGRSTRRTHRLPEPPTGTRHGLSSAIRYRSARSLHRRRNVRTAVASSRGGGRGARRAQVRCRSRAHRSCRRPRSPAELPRLRGAAGRSRPCERAGRRPSPPSDACAAGSVAAAVRMSRRMGVTSGATSAMSRPHSPTITFASEVVA